MKRKKKLIYELWKLIDDIDTAGDIAKGNDKLYRGLVNKYQSKRHSLIGRKDIDKLYDKYYKNNTHGMD